MTPRWRFLPFSREIQGRKLVVPVVSALTLGSLRKRPQVLHPADRGRGMSVSRITPWTIEEDWKVGTGRTTVPLLVVLL